VSLLQALILGVLQGGTEFLPVSSSGHLVLVPWLLNWEPAGLVFDAVVHWGTAFAVIVYFRRDWVALAGAAFRSLRVRSSAEPEARLVWLILLGTIPAAVVGYLLEDFFEGMFAEPVPAAGFLLVTAALLLLSERIGEPRRGLEGLNWRDALLIGMAQALAIFPGISRSGATIAAGLVVGLRREQAARFSFLLATPIILGAGLLQIADVVQVDGLETILPALAVGALAAAATGLVCIHFLIRYLRSRRLFPFVAYCALAGLFFLGVALLRIP
jgi:undecaprenyl-diphosphatase